MAVGAEPLEPEEALTFTAGIVAETGPVSLTADIYNIVVEDRLGVSKNTRLTDEQKSGIGSDACFPAADVLEVRYFGNGFDTRTRGIDVIASVDIPAMSAFLESGETEFVFVGNWTKTKVISHDPGFLDAKRILQLEDALPKYRFNATLHHEQAGWSAFARLNYFGPYTETFLNRTDLLIDGGSEFHARRRGDLQADGTGGVEHRRGERPQQFPGRESLPQRRSEISGIVADGPWRAVSTTSVSAMLFELREPARGRCQSKSA